MMHRKLTIVLSCCNEDLSLGFPITVYSKYISRLPNEAATILTHGVDQWLADETD